MTQILLTLLLATSHVAADTADVVDFDTDLVPVFTKAGCNAGSCHGGAAGRGGFKLSLFGGDADIDYQAIVRQFEGRRINLVSPEDSLVVLKPTGQTEHGGRRRLRRSGQGARLLVEWIRSGAQRLRLRQLTDLKVTPEHHIALGTGEKVMLRAVATFDDGTERDVTRWTVFTSSDPAALTVSDPDSGELTVKRRGQAVVVARYLSRVVPVRVTVPLSEEDITIAKGERKNFIDDHVNELLRTLRLAPAPAADDATFLRRARLALTGTVPPLAEIREFLASDERQKRSALVDRLLATDEFVDYWTYRFATLLRVRSLPNDQRVARAFQEWIRAQLERNTPYDDMAQTLLTASGDSHEHGEAAFYRMTANARGQAEFVSEVFLGARLRCANCHNHPLDRWTQDDYHGLAAIFARIERGRVVRLKKTGEVTHPATGLPAVPRLPGEHFLKVDGDSRGALAEWLAAGDNPFFARAIVNRLWKALMGRGLVESVDDLRATNPATHPELLDRLARDFVEHGFDLRHTLRRIANSAAFARGAKSADVARGTSGKGAGSPRDRHGDRLDDRYYSQSLVRPLGAEVLADAIADVTGVSDIYGEEPAGTRAVVLPDPKIPAPGLDLLGRCSREESCDSAPSVRGLAAELHLINGPLLNDKVSSPQGRLAKRISKETPNEAIVEEFYGRALGRFPRQQERAFWNEQLASAEGAERKQILEDFLWSLLTCREFKTNH